MSAGMFAQVDGAVRAMASDRGPIIGSCKYEGSLSVNLGFRPSFVILYQGSDASATKGTYIITEDMCVDVSDGKNSGSGHITDTGFNGVSTYSTAGRYFSYIAWK